MSREIINYKACQQTSGFTFIELQSYPSPKHHPKRPDIAFEPLPSAQKPLKKPKQQASTTFTPKTNTSQEKSIAQKTLTLPDKQSAYSLTDFFTQKCNSALGKVASSVSALSMRAVIDALIAAALKEAFFRGIDHFFDTNFLVATQDFIEQHLDFWKVAASIALPILVGIGLIALYVAYCAEKNHAHDQKLDNQHLLLSASHPAS